MPAFDDMFKKFFEQNEFPNPFDPEGFGRFIQEQIKSAMPENVENMPQQQQSGQSVDYSSHQPKNTTNLPSSSRRKGTTTGMGRQTSQPSQTGQSQHAQGNPKQNQHELNYQAFETHDDFIIRVEVVEDEQFHPKKIALNSHQLTFLNEEGNKPLLHIQLPKPVHPDQIKAGFRQGILEVKLPKKEDEEILRVDISGLYRPMEQQPKEQPKEQFKEQRQDLIQDPPDEAQ